MAPLTPRLRILSVGGNAVSAFLSWRLQATNACDVTLVWKSGYEHVAQYGITFKSPVFGNERFKPRHVVKTPEDASAPRDGPFDYVILCIKALPDVYDLAAVIESVVTPQHTCILINTTHTLGVESAIEDRFPTNVVLSLVAGAELSQLGQSEFEHKGSTEVWVGPANKANNIPTSIQDDMAQALAMTLGSGQVDCKVSPNIRQQQYERVIGPIAFHPISVIFETPSHIALLDKIGVKEMISDVIDELLRLAQAQGCKFSSEFKQKTIDDMIRVSSSDSIMWQDYLAKRPMEVETYLGSPIKLAREAKCLVPRIETLYAILYNLNVVNRQKPKISDSAAMPPPSSPTTVTSSPLPKMPVHNGGRPMMNGMPNGNMPRQARPRTSSNLSTAGMPGMRRPPPLGVNGMGPHNGHGHGRPMMNGPHMVNGQPRQPSRRGSLEGADLEEFSHLVHYDDASDGREHTYSHDPAELALRERELHLRQRELALREQELRRRRPMAPPGSSGHPLKRGPHPMRSSIQPYDEDEDDDDYFDPSSGSNMPQIDPDNFDMMSVTSRKHRKVPGPSPAQFRRNFDQDARPATRGGRIRPSSSNRNRSSQFGSIANLGENILDDPLLSCSSNRYGTVDRSTMHAESRSNSLTSARLDELQYGHGHGGPFMAGANGIPRRPSQSTSNMYSPSVRGVSDRPSPLVGYGMPPGPGGRPLPSEHLSQPVPRYPPGQGNSVAPQQVEQHVGVSALHLKSSNMRSLTGSASASAGSGETQLDSEPSAHSSQSSLQNRPPIGVR